MRDITINRVTNETTITLSLNLDRYEPSVIDTKIPFLDHMLTLFAFHSKVTLALTCDGDIEVDDHHSVEDIGLVLGEAIKKALGDKIGINRYGNSLLPMDETLARAVVDLSNRPVLVYKNDLKRDKLGTMDTQNVKEFFKSLVNTSMMTLHLKVFYGENDHHKVEALFKAFGRALREAITINGTELPSTKGVL